MRADRLLSILLLLQVHRKMTAYELAKRLEVSPRTIYRDIEALSTAGVPVTTERGTNGGLVLAEAFRTNLTGLNPQEIQALFLSRPRHVLNDLGLQQASEAALIKLQAVLPALSRYNAEYVRQRIHVDVAGWQRPEDEHLTFLPLLQEAIWQERKVGLDYQREDSTVTRVIDPLGLVAKGRIWYLAAAVEGQVRTYRVSRIQKINLLDEPCTRPHDFDLAHYWQESSADFVAQMPRTSVHVRLTQQALARAVHAGRFIQVEQISLPDSAGWATARMTFEIVDEMCGYLLSFGTEIEIIEPQALREQIIRLAENLLTFYAERETIESTSLGSCSEISSSI